MSCRQEREKLKPFLISRKRIYTEKDQKRGGQGRESAEQMKATGNERIASIYGKLQLP